MDYSSRSLSVYCRKRCSCSGTKQSSKLRCSGSTLGPMKLNGRWRIRCGLCILPFFSVEAKMFWYGVLVYVLIWCLGICFGIYFGHVAMCTYVYGCKYCHELCYKYPISGMGVMLLWLCCHVTMLSCGYVIMLLWCHLGWNLAGLIIVNIASSYVIKLHERYVLFPVVCWGICVIKHWGRCPPRQRVL